MDRGPTCRWSDHEHAGIQPELRWWKASVRTTTRNIVQSWRTAVWINIYVKPILGDPGAVNRVDKMSVVKVYCKIETSPWALTLTEPVPQAFELPASDWPQKIFLWPISENEQPVDSDVFLHDVVFLIDRHSCVARSTGKVSRGKFQN